jgi:hypothetical protein
MHRSIKPAWVFMVALIACAALASSAQARNTAKCGAGTVRGIAYVTGDVTKGIANLPFTYSSDAKLFGYRWNCSGGAVSVRLSSVSPGFDVKFAGNPGRVALATVVATTGAAAVVTRNADGSFHVSTAGDVSHGDFRARNDVAFVIIVF